MRKSIIDPFKGVSMDRLRVYVSLETFSSSSSKRFAMMILLRLENFAKSFSISKPLKSLPSVKVGS